MPGPGDDDTVDLGGALNKPSGESKRLEADIIVPWANHFRYNRTSISRVDLLVAFTSFTIKAPER